MTELWSGESEKTVHVCVHCGERSERGAKPFPRGLCPDCVGEKNRIEMHEENIKVMPNWACKVPQCAKFFPNLSTA